jgi:hypothetical protein
MHPGVTTSAILKGLGYEKGWDSAEFCAKTAVLLATAEEAGEGGWLKMETGTYWVNGEEVDCEWREKDEECQAVWEYCKKHAGLE